MSEEKLLEARIAAIRTSCSRSRSSLFVSAVVSAMICVAIWNTYFTWTRHLLELPDYAVAVRPGLGQTSRELTDSQLQDQVRLLLENRDINLGLLGIRVSSDDVPILGAFALCMLSLYQVLTFRRANRDVASLLIEAQDLPADEMRAVYFGVRSDLLFNTRKVNERPVNTLKYRFEASESEDADIAYSIRLLLYLPALATALAIGSDLFYGVVFSGDFDLHIAPVWHRLTNQLKMELIVVDLVSAIAGFFTWRYNRTSLAHINGIFALMVQFAERYSKRYGCSIYDPATAGQLPEADAKPREAAGAGVPVSS